MFIAALFTIARTWKQPKCPSTEFGFNWRELQGKERLALKVDGIGRVFQGVIETNNYFRRINITV